ncbi:hypothetical protein BDZ89DRAFT_1076856 [Hymenopellis radicata]|nr:hypothetical protein BDZ89DRAFT_1076856 [Hymenopellis radicata]
MHPARPAQIAATPSPLRLLDKTPTSNRRSPLTVCLSVDSVSPSYVLEAKITQKGSDME